MSYANVKSFILILLLAAVNAAVMSRGPAGLGDMGQRRGNGGGAFGGQISGFSGRWWPLCGLKSSQVASSSDSITRKGKVYLFQVFAMIAQLLLEPRYFSILSASPGS